MYKVPENQGDFQLRPYFKFSSEKDEMSSVIPYYFNKNKRCDCEMRYSMRYCSSFPCPAPGYYCRCCSDYQERRLWVPMKGPPESYLRPSPPHINGKLKSSSYADSYERPRRKKVISRSKALCTHCGTTETSLWRRLENQIVCNACGLYHKMHGVQRPISLKNTVIKKRRRSRRVFEDHAS